MGRARNSRLSGKRRDYGPPIFREPDSRYWKVDLRFYGMGRRVLRDPNDPRWPRHGERTESEEVALRWRWAYKDFAMGRITRRQLGHAPEGRKLGEAKEAFLRHQEQAVASPHTYASRRTGVNCLVARFGKDANTADITKERLQDLWDELLSEGYEASTIHEYNKGVKTLFSWLGGYNPATEVKLPEIGETDIRAWTDGEIERLREAADYVDGAGRAETWPSARLVLETLLATGGRQQELFALEWKRFDPERKSVRFVEQLDRANPNKRRPLKGKRLRTAVVLPFFWERYRPDMVGLVLGRTDGRALGFRQQTNLFTSILDAARLGGPGILYHRGRHTYARLFVELGGWPDELQRSLGHQSIRTTERIYEHFAGERAAETAAARIYGGGRIQRLK